MTNEERAEDFFQGAAWSYQDMKRALDARFWAMALRRAQEVIELSLKGLLLLMGADYPKSHDPAPAFFEVAKARGLEIEPAFEAELRVLSKELAGKRGPAFYREIPVTEEEARRAGEGATKVWEAVQRWWKECQKG
ncbi:MAG: HEPN domain-containing protein [Anaerolineae bacterium]